jgi:4-carboxymuconolactone decarboxylase
MPLRERELMILRAAWRAGCEYEFAQHRARIPLAGLTASELRRVCSEDDDWPPHEHALLSAVDELMRDGVVADSTWDGSAAPTRTTR